MGIRLSDENKFKLKERLKDILKEHNFVKETEINVFYTAILKTLEADSRWIRISANDLRVLSERFNKRIPEGDFRTNFGRIMVRRIRGVIHREYYSEETIVSGWHAALIADLRSNHNFSFSKDLTRELFELCQPFIMEQKAN